VLVLVQVEQHDGVAVGYCNDAALGPVTGPTPKPEADIHGDPAAAS